MKKLGCSSSSPAGACGDAPGDAGGRDKNRCSCPGARGDAPGDAGGRDKNLCSCPSCSSGSEDTNDNRDADGDTGSAVVVLAGLDVDEIVEEGVEGLDSSPDTGCTDRPADRQADRPPSVYPSDDRACDLVRSSHASHPTCEGERLTLDRLVRF